MKLLFKLKYNQLLLGESAGLTWIQFREKLRIAEEERQASGERAKIMEEFRELQKKVHPFLAFFFFLNFIS